MQVCELKEYLLNNGLIENVLSELGCGCIRDHGNYISASNPDGGDNKQAIILYVNESLNCIDYTRTISKTKRATDIFDLVSYFKECTFAESMKWVCGVVGLDYYHESTDLPESLYLIKLIKSMSTHSNEEIDIVLKPISENILNYYMDIGNILFVDDGISLETQHEWEIKYDPQTNSICIPIRDEIGNLIAVKNRRFAYTPDTPNEQCKFKHKLCIGESKYFFSEPGAKSQVLYGLYKNYEEIQKQGVVYVGESEKFTLQLYDMGYYGVSTGGSKVSKRQIEMLTRLGVKICFCFDKDITEEDLMEITNGFVNGISIYGMLDKDDILNKKESPSDDCRKWKHLIENNIYKIR